MKMSDDFSHMESYVESAVCGLRTVQGAGKYPKKVCSAAMRGANMLNAQKGAISKLRHDNDRMVEEIAELREFVKMISNGINKDPEAAVVHLRVHSREAKKLLAKLNQDGEE